MRRNRRQSRVRAEEKRRRKCNALSPQQLRREHRLTRLLILHILVVPVILHDIEDVALCSNVDRVLRHDLVDRAAEELDVALRVALDLTDQCCTGVGFLRGGGRVRTGLLNDRKGRRDEPA